MDDLVIHPAAVLAAALSSFVVGGAWYSPIGFARAWMREAGLDEARVRDAKMTRVFAGAFACSVVMALNLAAFLGPKASLAFGTFAGFATGLGWVSMSLGVIYLFEQRSFRLWLINSGYQVVSLTIMGAILGAWR